MKYNEDIKKGRDTMNYLEEYQKWCESPEFDEDTKKELLAIKEDEKEIFNKIMDDAISNLAEQKNNTPQKEVLFCAFGRLIRVLRENFLLHIS